MGHLTKSYFAHSTHPQEHHGITIDVLGVGLGPWSNGAKMHLLRDYLRQLAATDQALRERGAAGEYGAAELGVAGGVTLVCVVDGYDVVLTGSEPELLSRYRRFMHAQARVEKGTRAAQHVAAVDGQAHEEGGDEGGAALNDFDLDGTPPAMPVVFSGDHTFYFRFANDDALHDAYARAYPAAPTIYRFLNSGS